MKRPDFARLIAHVRHTGRVTVHTDRETATRLRTRYYLWRRIQRLKDADDGSDVAASVTPQGLTFRLKSDMAGLIREAINEGTQAPLGPAA